MAVLATPEQRAILDQVTAFMSLVEGHAEWVMNAVSPTIIPSQRTIERRFADRRKGGNPLDKLLRRLLGLEAKTRQYVDGSTFVRAVVDQVGRRAASTRSGRLATRCRPRPRSPAPADWVTRIHG